jgi:hypothetical protein
MAEQSPRPNPILVQVRWWALGGAIVYAVSGGIGGLPFFAILGCMTVGALLGAGIGAAVGVLVYTSQPPGTPPENPASRPPEQQP